MNHSPETTKELCAHRLVDGGIHHYAMNATSRAAVDQHFTHLETVLRAAPLDRPLRVLLDFRPAGFPSVSYAFRKAREMYSRVPEHPRMRFVFLHNPGVLTAVAQAMFNLIMVRDAARFFPAAQYDEAITWLLRDK